MQNERLYHELRMNALSIKPNSIKIKFGKEDIVYAAVVDVPVQSGHCSLVCVIDGTVSLYFSNGNTHVGLGQNESVLKAGMTFLISSTQVVKMLEKTDDTSLQIKPVSTVFLLTQNGIYKGDVQHSEKDSLPLNFLETLIQKVFDSIKDVYNVH